MTDFSANSSLQILWLDGNNISFVEENVFMNTSLEELRINDNKLTHLPELKTTRLTLLDIRRNLLSEVGFLSLLPALTNVRLHENPFPSTKSLVIGATQLETLECTQTAIEKMPVISVAKSSMLRISMHRNNIKCIDFVHLSNMTLLKVLSLAQNSIRRFPDPGCASNYSSTDASRDWQFPHLSFFSMRENGLIEFPLLPGMGTLASSAQIYVSRNEITNVSVTRLETLKYATNIDLDLRRNKITHMPYLSVLGPALVKVDLRYNEIANLHKEHLSGLVNLENLLLSDNRISSFDFSALFAPPRALSIELENNPILCDRRICLLSPGATSIIHLTCDAPSEHVGQSSAAYTLLKCGEYSHG